MVEDRSMSKLVLLSAIVLKRLSSGWKSCQQEGAGGGPSFDTTWFDDRRLRFEDCIFFRLTGANFFRNANRT